MAKRAPSVSRPRPRSRTRIAKIGRALGLSSRNASPEEKAIVHHVTGAGRSRVRRPFFDLTPTDVDEITTLLASRIEARLSK